MSVIQVATIAQVATALIPANSFSVEIIAISAMKR